MKAFTGKGFRGKVFNYRQGKGFRGIYYNKVYYNLLKIFMHIFNLLSALGF